MSANTTSGLSSQPAPTGLREIDRAIAEHYSRLSLGQRRAIDHLLADARYGAVISAPQLAVAVGVSESTITRAAQTLGFAGFPDLQRHLREQFVAPLQERLEPLAQDAAQPVSIATRVMLDDALHIQEMAEDLVASEIEAVVTTLIEARRVLVFGDRGSHGLALMLGIGMRLLLPDVRVIDQSAGDVADQLIGLGTEDVVVAISFRRVDRMTVNVLTRASKVGAATIALSDHRSSPASRAADRSLIARTGKLRLMPSFAPGASLVNALLEEVAARTQSSGVASERMQDAEALWEHFSSYAVE
ncbi:MAG: MurR/RpiR family transcriptional regulator [Thermomicrobiales bacterium]